MEKKKFSFLADEHTGSATLNSDAPVVGERANQAQQKQAQEKQEQEQEKKEQEEKEQQAGKCYVMNGAVLKCNLCTQPEGELVVTSNTIGLQADIWATETPTFQFVVYGKTTGKTNGHSNIVAINYYRQKTKQIRKPCKYALTLK
jgi:hypothetical protein